MVEREGTAESKGERGRDFDDGKQACYPVGEKGGDRQSAQNSRLLLPDHSKKCGGRPLCCGDKEESREAISIRGHYFGSCQGLIVVMRVRTVRPISSIKGTHRSWLRCWAPPKSRRSDKQNNHSRNFGVVGGGRPTEPARSVALQEE